MFIRKTKANDKALGEVYFNYRLIRGEHINGKLRQTTVLDLGRDFPLQAQDWPLFCSRLEQLLCPQEGGANIVCSPLIETTAQGCVKKLTVHVQPVPSIESYFQEIDINSMQQTQARSVGFEHCALHVVNQLGLPALLTEFGFSAPLRAAVLGHLIARMAVPALTAESEIWDWLQTKSALGELLEVDFESMSSENLELAIDFLMENNQEIEGRVFDGIRNQFNLAASDALFDLSYTFTEDGLSTLTLGLELDLSGFVRRSLSFITDEGAENSSLAHRLAALGAAPGAWVILNAGIATADNLTGLAENGYRYCVVQSGDAWQDEGMQRDECEIDPEDVLLLQKKMSADGREVLLYKFSARQEAEAGASYARYSQVYEKELKKISDRLDKLHGKCSAKNNILELKENIGLLQENSHGVSSFFTVNLETDASGEYASALTWEKKSFVTASEMFPDEYCLRSNDLSLDEERLGKMYKLLSDQEAVLLDLFNEADPCLFLSVLAYQCVQMLRTQLKAAGINQAWSMLRQTLSVHQRITSSFQRKQGGSVHQRQCIGADLDLRHIYKALGITSMPGGSKKWIS